MTVEPASGLADLRDTWQAVQEGRQPPEVIALGPLVEAALQALGPPPEGFAAQEPWLDAAADVLRWLSDLLAAKARALAPQSSAQQAGATGAAGDVGQGEGDASAQGSLFEGGLDLEGAAADGEARQLSEELARRAEAYARFARAAALLQEHAEAFGRHQPRREPSPLLESLRLLGPWPDAALDRIQVDQLAAALASVLQRHNLAVRAVHAPAPTLDWERVMDMVRNQVSQGPRPVGELLQLGAAERLIEVIARFLVMLELVRQGELELQERAEGLWVARRRPPMAPGSGPASPMPSTRD